MGIRFSARSRVGIAAALATATVVGAALAGTQSATVASSSADGPPPAALGANVAHLDGDLGPAVGSGPKQGVVSRGAAGSVTAYGFMTKAGLPAFVAELPDGSSVAGGCEESGRVTKCLSQFYPDRLVLIGRAEPGVAAVRVQTADGATTSIVVEHGVWAAVLPSTPYAPLALSGLTSGGNDIGADDGARIVRSLERDAASARANMETQEIMTFDGAVR